MWQHIYYTSSNIFTTRPFESKIFASPTLDVHPFISAINGTVIQLLYVCSPTFGLNMSGASWGGVFWRVMCWSKCLVLRLRYWNVPLEGWYYVSWPLSRRTFIVWTLLELYKCSIHCERDISRWLSACPPCSWWPRGEVATSSSSLSSLSYCWCPCPSSSRSARQATWRTNSTV